MTSPIHRNDKDEAGETLVEVLCTIIILGIAIAALVAGLGSTVLNTARHRDQATGNALLRSYTEALKQTVTGDKFYTPCRAVPYSVPADKYELPNGWAVPTNTVVAIPGCTPSTDLGTQQVHVTIVTPRNVTQSLDIWVRSPNPDL